MHVSTRIPRRCPLQALAVLVVAHREHLASHRAVDDARRFGRELCRVEPRLDDQVVLLEHEARSIVVCRLDPADVAPALAREPALQRARGALVLPGRAVWCVIRALVEVAPATPDPGCWGRSSDVARATPGDVARGRPGNAFDAPVVNWWSICRRGKKRKMGEYFSKSERVEKRARPCPGPVPHQRRTARCPHAHDRRRCRRCHRCGRRSMPTPPARSSCTC